MVKDHRSPRLGNRVDVGLHCVYAVLTANAIGAKIVKTTDMAHNARKTLDICVCRAHFVERSELRRSAYEDKPGSVERDCALAL